MNREQTYLNHLVCEYTAAEAILELEFEGCGLVIYEGEGESEETPIVFIGPDTYEVAEDGSTTWLGCCEPECRCPAQHKFDVRGAIDWHTFKPPILLGIVDRIAEWKQAGKPSVHT